jgi:hypothetical protein
VNLYTCSCNKAHNPFSGKQEEEKAEEKCARRRNHRVLHFMYAQDVRMTKEHRKSTNINFSQEFGIF